MQGELISSYPNPSGVLFLKEPKMCFISGYYLIETKIELDRWNLKANQVMEQLKRYMQKPYQESQVDLRNARKRRTTTPRVSKSTKAQAFTIASVHRYAEYLENIAIPQIFSGYTALFRNAKTSFSPFPFTTYSISRGPSFTGTLPHLNQNLKRGYLSIANPLDPAEWNIYFTLLKKLNEPEDLIDLGSGQIRFVTEEKPIRDQLLQIENSVDTIQDLLEQALDALNDLQQGRVPLHIHDYDELSVMLDDIVKSQPFPVFSAKELLIHLRTHTNTYVLRDDCSDPIPSASCGMYAVTYVPILSKKQSYDPFSIITLPVIKPGILRDNWIQLKLDETNILINEYSAKLYKPEHNWCVETPVSDCQVCVSKQRERIIPSICFLTLLHDDYDLARILRDCPYEKLYVIGDRAVILDANNIAYVNPHPGSLVERCEGSPPNNQQLLPFGMLHLNNSCAYEMLNGPLTGDDSYLSALTVTNLIENPTIVINEMDRSMLIEHHLQEYAVTYVITLSAILIFLLFILFCSCCCRERLRQIVQCCRRINQIRSRQGVQRVVHQPQIEATAPEYREPYREVRVQLNNMQNLVRRHLASSVI